MNRAALTLFSLRLPLRFLRGSYSRLLLTVVAMACGVAQVIGTDLIARESFRTFSDVIDTVAGRAALQVTSGEKAVFSDEIAGVIATVPGVERTVPVVSAVAFPTDESGEMLTVHGIDVADKRTVAVYELQGRDSGLSDPKLLLPGTVAVPRALAERRAIGLGDTLEIDTRRGRQRVTVRGILDPQGLARLYGGNLLLMDLPNAQDMFGEPGLVSRIDVVIDRSGDVERVAREIGGRLPQGLHVERPIQRRADLQAVIGAMRSLLRSIGLFGLLGAFLVSFNSLSTLFEGRAWQLGVLRAAGVRPRAMWLELLKESALLGVAGVALGIPIGVVGGRLASPMVTTAAALTWKMATPPARIDVNPLSLVLGAALGMAAAMAAAALPAWRATRIGMAQTMHGRGTELESAGGDSRRLLRVVALASVAVSVALQSATGLAVWGLAATVLIALATALAARPLLDVAWRPLLGVFRRMAGPSGELAVKNLAQNPRRSALTTAMLAVGLSCVGWLWMVAHSFETSVVEAVGGAIRADLVVGSVHIESGFLEAPVTGELVAAIAAVAGVETVVGERAADWHYGGGPICIDAYDPAYFAGADFGQWPLTGRGVPDMWQQVAAGQAAVVSSSFARNMGLGMGDTVELESPAGPLKLPIAGIVTHFGSQRGTVEMSRELYRRYWNDDDVTHVFVRTTRDADPAGVRAAIAQRFGRAYGLRILSSGDLANYFGSQVRRAFDGVYVLAAVIFGMLLVGIADTLAAGVMERTREIGAIRVVGVRRRCIHRMVLFEAIVLGTMGIALAAVSALALGTLWAEGTFPAMLGWVIKPWIPYRRAALAAGLMTLICLCAALGPARRAAGLEPAAALRCE